MKANFKISISSTKYGNHNPNGTDPDLYINGRSAYAQTTESQVFTARKDTNRFLCALIEEHEDIKKSSEMKGLETFERLDRKISKEEMKLEDAVSEIAGTIQDLADINTSETEENQSASSYLSLYLDGEYGVCVNYGLQSAYYYDSINMISLTPAAENPDKLIKMGIISDEQAELVRKDILKSSDRINVSKMIRLVNEGVFILMNSSMSGYFDELDVENCIETLRDPEPIGKYLMEEAVNNDQDKDYSVTVIKIEATKTQEAPKKKIPAVEAQSKGSQAKGHPERKASPVSGQRLDPAKTIKVPSMKVPKGIVDPEVESIDEDNDHDEAVGMTRKIEPIPKKNPSKAQYILTYFSSRIFTVIVIVGVLSGVVIGLVHLASLVFSDNVVPPAYTDVTGDTTTRGSILTTVTTSQSETQETTTSAVTSVTTDPQYTMPNITDAEIIHEVKAGETLSHIAMLYYNDQTKYSLIMEANNITNPASLQIGQKLKIPPLPKTSETTTGN